MREIEVKGKNIEEAVKKGLKQLGVERDQVDVRVLDEGKTGLFGLMGSSPAKVKIILKPGVGKEIDYNAIALNVLKKVEKIIELMELNLTAKATYIAGRIMIEIQGEDSRIIIGKSGQTLNALEILINYIVGREEKSRVKVSVDAEMYRVRQEEKIKSLARTAAKKVKESGREIELRPMSPNERRLVHLTLEHDKDVTTISKGTGIDRKIVIIPRKKISTFN